MEQLTDLASRLNIGEVKERTESCCYSFLLEQQIGKAIKQLGKQIAVSERGRIQGGKMCSVLNPLRFLWTFK